MRARALAVLGTGSDVGKSVITAGLCRLFLRAGRRVAPFKAQNMSNNSFVTPDGKELGRAQALQAEACGLEPDADMNPILLKPESDRTTQIVVQGAVWGKADAAAYFQGQHDLIERVRESYDRLASRYDMIVIEGAGSAAEVNLRDRDLANWSMVEWADAQVVLVADIDRGGVFAQILGTLDLLHPSERARVAGIIVNKFRGDRSLFEDGVAFLEQRSGLPVLGVVPMLRNLILDQEDSLDITRFRSSVFEPDRVNIAVVLLPRMSNFTDFDQLAGEPDVVLRYAARPTDLDGADVVMLPGSKNTIGDLRALRESGMAEAICAGHRRGCEVVGICGGYQMLGREIGDPEGIESGGEMMGLGLLDCMTTIQSRKITEQIHGYWLHGDTDVPPSINGYAIHMGQTDRGREVPCFRIWSARTGPEAGVASLDGAVSQDGRTWGSYIHGLFDQPGFRRRWLNRIRLRKSLTPLDISVSNQVAAQKCEELDRWADHLHAHLTRAPFLRSEGEPFKPSADIA